MKPYLIQPTKLVSPFIQWFRYILLMFFHLFIKEIKGQENLPKEGPYIIACNHIDLSDGFFVAAAVVLHVRKMVYFVSRVAPWGWLWKKVIAERYACTISYDPKNKDACLITAMDRLATGKIIGFFPEGTSWPEKDLKKGKTGMARLSLWTKVPVVPIGIKNIPSRSKLGAIYRKFFTQKHVIINIGKLMKFDKYYNQEITKELLEKVTREVMLEISKLCGKKYLY